MWNPSFDVASKLIEKNHDGSRGFILAITLNKADDLAHHTYVPPTVDCDSIFHTATCTTYGFLVAGNVVTAHTG